MARTTAAITNVVFGPRSTRLEQTDWHIVDTCSVKKNIVRAKFFSFRITVKETGDALAEQFKAIASRDY